jgi:alpha-tubulin suppressor-like RCC1 family protein
VATVAAGFDFSVFLMEDGTVRTCGGNEHGQLGYITPDHEPNPIPKEVKGLENIVCIACGYYNTLAIRSDGHVFSWGYNLLGLGKHVKQRTHPTELNGIDNAIDIACGRFHAVILLEDGTIRSFSSSTEADEDWIYQLVGFSEAIENPSYPEPVPEIRDAIAVACGDHHTTVMVEPDDDYAARKPGAILFFMFGDNSRKQFGAELPADATRGVLERYQGIWTNIQVPPM